MTNIIALVARLACTLAAGMLVGRAAASDAAAASGFADLPGGSSLTVDANRWSQEYSVFQLAVVEPVGAFGSGFAASIDPRLKPLTRLDSSWSLTSPWNPVPVRVGDGVSSADLWQQPVRMGGIQIGTLQPAPPEVVAPPGFLDSAPSAGPLALTTTRFIDRLHSSTLFLPQALSAEGQCGFSFESGRIREDFEVRSNDYGPWLTSGSYRYGIGPATTVDGRIAQVAGQQGYLGVGVLEGLGPLGLVSAGVGSSHDQDTSGWLARLGYEFSRDGFNFAIRSHVQSAGYQEVGDPGYIESLRQRTLASAGVDFGGYGLVSLASASQTAADDGRRDMIALSHAVPIAGGGILSTAAAYSPGQSGSSAVWLSFIYPFDSFGAPAGRLNTAANTALDRTITDVFGDTRLPPTARALTDRVAQP